MAVDGRHFTWTLAAGQALDNLEAGTGHLYKAVSLATGQVAANGRDAGGLLLYGGRAGEPVTLGYAGVMKFTAGAPLSVPFEWVRRFVEQSAPLLPGGETAVTADDPALTGLSAEPGAGNGAGNSADPSAALARAAGRVMAERHLSYSEAAALVLRENAELARAYRDFTLNPYQGA